MKVFRFPLILIFLTFSAMATLAQTPTEPPKTDGAPPKEERPNLLAALGLSPEQVQQIRRLNQERKPAMQEAQRRLRISMRDLDMAIYGDSVSDADFDAKLKEHQAAQAEVARLRFEGELAIRKVLTPEQLIRFRDIRRRFAEARENFQKERKMQDRPLRRPLNGQPPPRKPV
ncbi:MAG TPA: periplasmic heavy metal sensor [Pyrinomonadaceae bacterium]|jgi:Spy/CpxP family protein refolding chaperone|nr:periplasmic heavy metal sensor [Pyrinomonadaceae bacterium]